MPRRAKPSRNQSWYFFIVTPSFNQGHFLKQTLSSILKQSLPAHVMVFDGGSTDSSVNILKGLGKKVFWQSKPDKGQSDALNKGVKQVFIEIKRRQLPLDRCIFAYLNSDDYLQPQALQHVVAAFEAQPHRHWVTGDCVIVDAKGREIQTAVRAYKKLWRRLLSYSLLLVLNPIAQPATFIKATALKKTGTFNQRLRYTMDYEYWLRLWQRVGPPITIYATLAAFRIHNQSKGSTSYDVQFNEQHQVASKLATGSAWLFFQSLHNRLIITAYNIIKS